MPELGFRGHRGRWLLSLLGPALLIFILNSIDLDQLLFELQLVDGWTMLYSGILAILVILVKGIRWHALVTAYGITIKLRSSILINFEGAFWGGITPGRLGEFVKAKRMQEVTGSQLFDGVILCSLDKLFDLLAVVSMLLISGFIVAPEFLVSLATASVESIFDHSTMILCVSIFALVISIVVARYIRARLVQISSSLRRYSGVRGLYIFLISSLSLVVYISAVYVIASPILPGISFLKVAFFVVLTMIAGALPISIGNIGPRDLIAIAILGFWGFDREVAIAVSFLMVFLYLIATLGSWAICKMDTIEKHYLESTCNEGRPKTRSGNFGD
jgi:glycosyltransferase 2 family protein